MASMFRKMGASLAPMFRKSTSDFGRFGRKLSSIANTVESGLNKADNFLGKVDRAVPNPITKAVRGAIGGVADVAGGVSRGGKALDALSRGDYRTAYTLGKQGLNEAGGGVGNLGKSVATIAPLIL